jgi:hypothetical protein
LDFKPMYWLAGVHCSDERFAPVVRITDAGGRRQLSDRYTTAISPAVMPRRRASVIPQPLCSIASSEVLMAIVPPDQNLASDMSPSIGADQGFRLRAAS